MQITKAEISIGRSVFKKLIKFKQASDSNSFYSVKLAFLFIFIFQLHMTTLFSLGCNLQETHSLFQCWHYSRPHLMLSKVITQLSSNREIKTRAKIREINRIIQVSKPDELQDC